MRKGLCINMIELNEYLHNPCGTSSIPYWKSRSITVPSDMKILHADDLHPSEWLDYSDEPYFRLSHNLKKLSAPVLGEGYLLCDASLADFAAHINFCYDSRNTFFGLYMTRLYGLLFGNAKPVKL